MYSLVVALKVIKSATEFYASGVEEITMLKRVRKFEEQQGHGQGQGQQQSPRANAIRSHNDKESSLRLTSPNTNNGAAVLSSSSPSCLIRLLDHFQIAGQFGTRTLF
jgi:hypothetical protein